MILTVAIPVEVLRGHKSAWRAHEPKKSLRGIPNASRLLGQPLTVGAVVRQRKTFQLADSALHSAELWNLRFSGTILVLNWKINSTVGGEIRTLGKIRDSKNASVLEALRLKAESQQSVDPVVGLTFLRGQKPEELNSSWMILESPDARNLVFTSVLTEQLVTRVAIERSLLQWSTRAWKVWLVVPVKAPITAFMVRRWNSSLLTSRPELQAQYLRLREAFNFPNVRAEVLDRARSWWASAAFLVGLAALLVSIFSRG